MAGAQATQAAAKAGVTSTLEFAATQTGTWAVMATRSGSQRSPHTVKVPMGGRGMTAAPVCGPRTSSGIQSAPEPVHRAGRAGHRSVPDLPIRRRGGG